MRAACRQADTAREHARARPGAASAVTSLRVAEDILADARARLPVQAIPGTDLPELNAQLAASDTALSFARAEFNAAVAAYNEAVRQFPTVLVARLFSFRTRGRVLAARAPDTHCQERPPRHDRPRRPAPRLGQREAADRLSRVHGAGELQAVLLALLLPPDSKRALRAWRQRGRSDARRRRAAPRTRPASRGAARLPWFELLLARMARQPLAGSPGAAAGDPSRDGRARRRPADRPPALADDAARPRRSRPARGAARAPVEVAEWLESDVLSVAAYTAFLSRMVPGETADESRGPRLVRRRHGDLAAVRRNSRVAAAEGRGDGRGARPDADPVVDAAAGRRPQLGDVGDRRSRATCASAICPPMPCA